jgi:hypothetical protein
MFSLRGLIKRDVEFRRSDYFAYIANQPPIYGELPV